MWPNRTDLIGGRSTHVLARINRRTAGLRQVSRRQTTIARQRAELRISTHDVVVLAVGESARMRRVANQVEGTGGIDRTQQVIRQPRRAAPVSGDDRVLQRRRGTRGEDVRVNPRTLPQRLRSEIRGITQIIDDRDVGQRGNTLIRDTSAQIARAVAGDRHIRQ